MRNETQTSKGRFDQRKKKMTSYRNKHSKWMKRFRRSVGTFAKSKPSLTRLLKNVKRKMKNC